MTLHTRIAVLAPVPLDELHRFINERCLGVDFGTVKHNDFHNEPMQGFDAWLWIEHGADGAAVYPLPVWCEHDEPWDEYAAEVARSPKDRLYHPAMWAEINLDTAYSGVSREGHGCSASHALYILRIGAWLAERGVAWRWYDEFAGSWHDGYEHLIEFVGSGAKAEQWFGTEALPAILAHASAATS